MPYWIYSDPNAPGDREDRASLITQTRDAIAELTKTVDWLASSLLPGTARPYTAPKMSAARRAQLDAIWRLERVAAGKTATSVPLGESPVPLDLDVADLLSEIMSTADELAERICLLIMRPISRPATSAFADPRPALELIAEHVGFARQLDVGLVVQIRDRCEDLVDRAQQSLGLVVDGQLLPLCCPWCGGKTEKHPLGGQHTLRVRTLPGGLPVIVCEGGQCEPPSRDCGIRWRGRPAWERHDWEWLAMKIERTEAS